MDGKTLTLDEYREMVEKVIDYKNNNNEMPTKIVISDIEINKEEYIDMIERVNKFILEIGRSPKSIKIKKYNDEINLNNLNY